MTNLINIKGIGPKLAVTLMGHGYSDIEKLAGATPAELIKSPGVSEAGAKRFIATAKSLLAQNMPTKTPSKQIIKSTQPKGTVMSKAKDSKKSDKPAQDLKEKKVKDEKKTNKKNVEKIIDKLKKKIKKLKNLKKKVKKLKKKLS